MNWQPIEKAPKDEQWEDGHNRYADYILVWWPGAFAVTRARWWFRDDGESCNFIADGGWACFPTHWMPLPNPPEFSR